VAGGDTAENIPVPATEHHINIITLRDLEAEAQKVLAAYSFAFAAGGAGDEWTMRENEAAIDRWVIEPNFLSGHSAPDLTTTLFGSKLGMPVITAPVATCKRKPK
jgi:isopentenyl diphosphate isomerase/L-lactate dehydrogenase-like FMN-dependent dehydrogenase